MTQPKKPLGHRFTPGRTARDAIATAVLAVSLVCSGPGRADAANAGTTAGTTITNMIRVEYMDANNKGVNGTPTPIVKSAAVDVAVELKSAPPSIGASTPASGQTADSGSVLSYDFPVWSNANGMDGYTLDVNPFTVTTNTTWRERYISAVTDAGGAVSNPVAGTTSVSFNIGSSTIVGNDANSVTIPFGTKLANHITDGDLIMIDGSPYKVGTTIVAGSAAVYDASGNTLTAEQPTVIGITTTGGGAPGLPTSGTGLAGATLSELFLVTVAVSAQGDPLQDKGTVCFNATLAATATPASNFTNGDTCTDFTSSKLLIAKSADRADGKPGEFIEYTVDVTVSGAAATTVTVTDAVPVYTTLVTYTDSYGGSIQGGAFANADFFASVSPDNGANAYSLTVQGGDDETSGSGSIGTGKVATFGGNLRDMTFYLGTGATSGAGGSITVAQHYKLKYRVRIN